MIRAEKRLRQLLYASGAKPGRAVHTRGGIGFVAETVAKWH